MEFVYGEKNIGSNKNVNFFIYKIDDIEHETYKVLLDLFDMTWLNSLNDRHAINSFKSKALKTAKKIQERIIKKSDDGELVREAGEHIVVYNALNVIEKELNYKKIPLGESFKNRVINNGGFDYFAENLVEYGVCFGEGKYRNDGSCNSFKSALQQVLDFIKDNKDTEEYDELMYFLDEKTKELYDDNKEYSIGFSIDGTYMNTVLPRDIFEMISKNVDFIELEKNKRLHIIGIVFGD